MTAARWLEDRAAGLAALVNGDAEQYLLGSILVDNRNFRRVSGFIRTEHFGNALHGRIFDAIAQRIALEKTATPVTLKNHFDRDDALTDIGGGQYLAQLAGAGALIDVEDYAHVVLDLANRRVLFALAQDAMSQAVMVDKNCTADIAAILENGLADLRRDAPDRLAGIDPCSLEGLPVPVRRFIVTPWIPIRRATGLYGAGGIGKTTLMQMLCTSTALDPAKFSNANWLGLPVMHCRSVLLFCEDDLDEMHARQEEINRAYGCTFDDLGDMLWLPRLGNDNTLMTFENGRACRTPFFWELLSLIKAHRAQLAVWDTVTDVFGGSEIDRRQVRQFVQEGPAYVAREINGSVICCGHPSLTGTKNGTGASGSTAWDGTFRSRLYLSAPKEEDGEAPDTNERILTRIKANWAKIGDPILMRWHDGVFLNKNPPTGIIASIERRTCDRVFLDLLDAATSEKQPVSPNISARNYAPRMFVKRIAAAEREGFKIRDFEQAMWRLMKENQPQIIAEQYGRKGDERWRIVRAPCATRAANE